MAHTNDNCGAWVIELLEVGPKAKAKSGGKSAEAT
jgi:hypothetical protein